MPPFVGAQLRAGHSPREGSFRPRLVSDRHAEGRASSNHFHAVRSDTASGGRKKAQAAARPFEHMVLVRPTSTQSITNTSGDKRIEFQRFYQSLVDDESRNQVICNEIIQAVREGRSPLVLTERNEHLDRLEGGLAANVPHVVALRAGMGKRQRRAEADRLAAIPPEEGRVILATGKYIGEGFDDPRLDTLFLTLPVSWRGTIAQYVGRLHRLYDGKREVRVYDYADLNVPMLARMFDRRCRGYEAVGYTIVLPASAIPG